MSPQLDAVRTFPGQDRMPLDAPLSVRSLQYTDWTIYRNLGTSYLATPGQTARSRAARYLMWLWLTGRLGRLVQALLAAMLRSLTFS